MFQFHIYLPQMDSLLPKLCGHISDSISQFWRKRAWQKIQRRHSFALILLLFLCSEVVSYDCSYYSADKERDYSLVGSGGPGWPISCQ
jgi:hypothetical protein